MKKRRKELYLSCSLLNRGHIAKYGISLYCIHLLSLLPRRTDDDADRNFWSIKYKRACNNHNTRSQKKLIDRRQKLPIISLPFLCDSDSLWCIHKIEIFFFFKKIILRRSTPFSIKKNIQRFTQRTGGTVQAWCVGLLKSLLDKKKKTCRR